MVTIPFVWLQLVEAKQHCQQWHTFYPIEESFIKWVHVTFSHQSVTHIAHHMSNAIKRLHLSTLNLNILKFNYHNHKYGNIKKRSLFIWGRFIYLWLIDWLIDLMEFSIHSKPITASTRVCVCVSCRAVSIFELVRSRSLNKIVPMEVFCCRLFLLLLRFFLVCAYYIHQYVVQYDHWEHIDDDDCYKDAYT